MRHKLYTYTGFFLCLFLGGITMEACAVTSKNPKKTGVWYKKALELYKKSAYADALELLDKIEKTDPSFPDTYFLRADTYSRLGNKENETAAIERGLTLDSLKYTSYYFILGEIYLKAGNYDKAEKCYVNYLAKDKRLNNELVAKKQLANSRFAINALTTSVKGATKLYISSEHDVYWPSLGIDGKTVLYTMQVGNEENIVMRKGERDILLDMNTSQQEGTQSLTADGQMFYFTGCGLPDSKGRCDIYVCYKTSDTTWSEPINLGEPINTDAWDAQPAISPDGTKLFFASTRSGGKGKSDIWCSTLLGRNEHGRQYWSPPVNLYFNTQGEEMAPSLYFDAKTLFFSSDDYPGMGGMDIYKVYLDRLGEPENMGITVNTHKNELGFIVDASGEKGYFASDREGKKNIYSCMLEKEKSCPAVSYMYLDVKDKTGRNIRPDKLLVRSLCITDTLAFYDGANLSGEMLTYLRPDDVLLFSVLKKGYMFYSDTLHLGQALHALPRRKEIILKDLNVGESLVLKGVLFDIDAYALKRESIEELNVLLEFLRANPAVKIEISGYTDNTGTDKHNETLSENRAFEVYKYLFINHIKKERMSYKGYGKNNPVVPNDTEENKAINRRTEVRITGY